MYDVIVIGAGPAGCTAAHELARSGKKVLLVEKFKLPRNKSCSGILIKKSMDLVSRYFGEDVPAHTMCTPQDNRGMIFTSDNGREYRFEQEGINIRRSSFDHWLAAKAGEAGAELRDGTAALSCAEQDDCVLVNLKGASVYSEKAKYIVFCGGVTGSVKRKLTHTPKNFITTFQTFNKGSIDLDPHYFYAYLQPQLSEYDAWFNVKDGCLILGVAGTDAGKLAHYYAEFVDYMKTSHNAVIEKQERTEKWLMPRIMPGCPIEYGKGKVLFAGEAAGFLNPMGEGISAAMESGHAAARAVMDTSGEWDMHAIYKASLNNTSALKKYMEGQWNFVSKISGKFDYMRYRRL